MSTKSKKNEEELFLAFFRYLPVSARQEALSYMGYLLAKSETSEDATNEILSDAMAVTGIKRGLQELKEGKVTEVEF